MQSLDDERRRATTTGGRTGTVPAPRAADASGVEPGAPLSGAAEYRLLRQAPGLIIVTHGADHRVAFVNDAHRALMGSDDWLGRPLAEAMGARLGAQCLAQLDHVFHSGETLQVDALEVPASNPGAASGRCYDFLYAPVSDDEGQVTGVFCQGHDVTERRRAREEIAESEARFRDIADMAPNLIWLMDENRSCTWVNRSWCAFTGRSLEQEVGDGWVANIHPDDLPAAFAAFEAAFEARELLRVEYRLRRHDGRWRIVDETAAPRFAGDGRFLGYIGSCLDITDQCAAEQHLRDSVEANAKFRTLFDQGMQFAALLARDGTVLDCNRIALDTCGFERDEALGRPFCDGPWWRPQPELAARVREACAQAAAGNVFRSETPYAIADGSVRHLDLIIAPVIGAHGRILFLNATGVDVTERVASEQALQRSRAASARQQRLYEAILANTPDLAYIFDRQHRFIYANEVLLQMWGRSWDDAIGKTCLELGYEPWHAEMHGREIDQVFETRLPVTGEVPFAGAFGRRMYEYIFVPVIGADGEVEAVAGTTRDVTDRNAQAQQLRDLASQLAESDRRKTEFLAMLAHELRNPLAPIRNAMEIIQRAGPNRALVATALGVMQRQMTQMTRLVDDLLDIGRISRGSIALSREPVLLADVIQRAVETCRPALETADQQVDVALPSGALVVDADALRLAQAIGNVIDNASRHGPAHACIRVRGEIVGGAVAVHVIDEGAGVPRDMRERIFDMFVQMERRGDYVRSGLGIGLSLARSLIEAHGGQLRHAEAPEGDGGDFVVTLPLVVESAEEPARETTAAREISGRRVLIVDDNEDAARSMARILELTDNVTYVAHDGLMAVDAARAFGPDLVLLDIGLPGLDGYEVCRRILAQADSPKPVVVAVTGWGYAEDRRRSAEAGFAAHLVKPVRFDELAGVVAELTMARVPAE